jgi:hypothetical protein
MDKNKFLLGGRLFDTASPRLGTPMQRKVRPKDGRSNATQGTSASWAPQRNARHVRKLGAPMQRKSHLQLGRPSPRPQRKRKARPHVPKLGTPTQRKARPQVGRPNAMQHKARPQVGHPNATQGTSTSWAPQCNARHVRKLGAPAHVCKLGAPTHVRNANARLVHTSASWAPQRNTRNVRKMVTQTQNSSATKTSTQGRIRLKDEMEDG